MLCILRYIEDKLDDNIFEAVEEYLWETNRPRLGTAVCTLAKIMTSKGERRKLYRWLKKWRDLKQKEPSLLRRDLRLIEERDMFRDCQCCRKAGQRGRIHPNMMILKGEEGLA